MYRVGMLAAALSVGISAPAAAQSLAGLQLGDTEAAAVGVLGPGYQRKSIAGRPGATALIKDNLRVTLCSGVITGLRASQQSDLLDYGRRVDNEAKRQGFGRTSMSYSETGPMPNTGQSMRMSLLMTSWRSNGFVTNLELSAVGDAKVMVGMMLALEYRTDPDPCARS